jgi:hypothetical protein
MGETTRAVREELLEPLRRTARWLLALRDGEGRIVCPEHRLEHTGKSACAAILFAHLAEHDPEGGKWGAAAVEQGRRLVANLAREGTSACHTFRPGRYDPYNNSNHVIDGGACSDALSELVGRAGPQLSADDREAFASASLLHARTYLRYAVLDKGIPAQRAWGLTGLAGAFALEPDPELERAGIEAVGVLEGIQHPDGSYPYHPVEWGGAHVGASDASAFYQSRVTAFLLFALERMGRDPRDATFAVPLQRGLRFLRALAGPDGIKCGLVEAKPWYWGAEYEVASHPFDVFALARGGQLFGDPALGRAALRAFRAWVDHLGPDGVPTSHHPGPGRGRSYQCPLFWAAHACWLARALPELERTAARGEPEAGGGAGLEIAVTHFPSVDLARIEDGAVVAWVRGRRPGYNVHHGSPHGAGLLRAVRRADGAELVERRRLRADQEGEWSRSFGVPSLGRGWPSGASELRFSAWLARNHWRGGRATSALLAPLDVLRRGVLDFASARASSAFPVEAELTVRDDGVAVAGGLAWRGGEPVPGWRTQRVFRMAGDGLEVSERVEGPGRARAPGYRLPAAAREVRGAGTAQLAFRLT